jgi:hypothetical protein
MTSTPAIASAGSGSYTFHVTAVGDGSSTTDSAASAESAVYTYTADTATYSIPRRRAAAGSISPCGTISVAAGGSQSFCHYAKKSLTVISSKTVDSVDQGAISTTRLQM